MMSDNSGTRQIANLTSYRQREDLKLAEGRRSYSIELAIKLLGAGSLPEAVVKAADVFDRFIRSGEVPEVAPVVAPASN